MILCLICTSFGWVIFLRYNRMCFFVRRKLYSKTRIDWPTLDIFQLNLASGIDLFQPTYLFL